MEKRRSGSNHKSLTLRIKQHFCKHEWHMQRGEDGPFLIISGTRITKKCAKCGKIAETIFVSYEGSGYK